MITAPVIEHAYPPPAPVAVRADLTRRVTQAGLLASRRGNYEVKITETLLAFAGGWAAFALAGPSIVSRPDRTVEILVSAAHVAAYLGAVFVVLPVWPGVASVAVHQTVFGPYTGCSFAPNHKGKPVLTGEEEPDYVRRQVLTSRNLRRGLFTDFALGGPHDRIEHHPFPNMPRPNLRRADPVVRAFCAERGVPSAETGLIESYRIVLRHLDDVGRSARVG